MEQRLAKLETLCKQKEEERVELELRLTEVKENLKKSLARGAMGPPTDTKISVKVGGYKVQNHNLHLYCMILMCPATMFIFCQEILVFCIILAGYFGIECTVFAVLLRH